MVRDVRVCITEPYQMHAEILEFIFFRREQKRREREFDKQWC